MGTLGLILVRHFPKKSGNAAIPRSGKNTAVIVKAQKTYHKKGHLQPLGLYSLVRGFRRTYKWGGGGLYLRGILPRIEKGIQNKARVVRVKICFVLIFNVF